MTLPDRITYEWMGTLDNESLLTAERSLHQAFADGEATERRRRGNTYDLMKGPAELLNAWDRWSRVNTETRQRKLHPRRVTRV